MKIAVWHNLPSGGGKRALFYHVRGLVERGHTVESWCPPSADQTYLPLSRLITEHVVPLETVEMRPRGRFRRAFAFYDFVVGRIQAMDRHSRQCAEEIRKGGFDLLFANSCQMFSAAAIGRFIPSPKCLYLQEPHRRFYEAHPELPWLLPAGADATDWSPKRWRGHLHDLAHLQGLRLYARQELENAKAYDALLVNSYFSRESIRRSYGLDARVCYLGIDTNLFVAREQAREDLVVGLGSFNPEKNVRLAIQAVAQMKAPRPTLVWVGNSNHASYLEQMQELAAQTGVTFQPVLRATDEELVGLLNRARAMVYAPWLEPFGFAPLEANACGVPVVAVAEGGVRETIIAGVNGVLVEPTSLAVAEALELLLSDHVFAERLGAGARRLVEERWSLPASIDRLERRFAEVREGRVKE